MLKNIIFAVFVAFCFAGCLASTTGSGLVGADRGQLMLISSATMDEAATTEYAKIIDAAKTAGTLNKDAKTTNRVKNIANRLINQVGTFREDATSWDWQVNVITEDTVNAWCMPGGKIVVYTGIIEKLSLSDAQLAAIVGHEIAHALREHSREQASQDQLRSLGVLAVGELAGLGDLGVNILNLASQYTITLPFSRSHETESDHIGTELMARAGYDPNEAVVVWEKMEKLGGSNMPEILSTHPSHATRIKDLKEIAQKVYPLYQEAKK